MMIDRTDQYRLTTFGPVGLVRTDGTTVASVVSRSKRLALLIYLAVSPGGRSRRDTVLGIFWPDFDDARARAALSKAIHYLRNELGGHVVIADRQEEIGVDLNHSFCDAQDFVSAVSQGDGERALGIYAGDFLEGFYLKDAPAFEQWTEMTRQELKRRAAQTAEAVTRGVAETGDHSAEAGWARRWTQLAPFDEAAARALMTAWDKLGEPAKVLEAFDDLKKRLAELDLEPTPATHRLAMHKVMSAEQQPIAGERQAVPVNVQAAVGDPAFALPGLQPPNVARSSGVQRAWLVRLVLGVVTGVAFLGVGVAWFGARDRPPPPAVVRNEFPLPPAVTRPDSPAWIALSPDGSRMVFVGENPLGTRLLFSRSLDVTDPVPIPRTENATIPFFSHDGQWIGFVQGDHLRRVPLSGGVVETISPAPDFLGASWGPDDTIVFSSRGRLYTVPASGGEPELLAAPEAEIAVGRDVRYGSPHVLPDGKAVLFGRWAVEDGIATLGFLSFEDREVTLLDQPGEKPEYVNGGFVVYRVLGGGLMAAQLDADRKRLGEARQIADRVLIGQHAVSRTGTVVHVSAPPSTRELVVVDRNGNQSVLPGASGRVFAHPRFRPDGKVIAVRVASAGANRGDIYTYDMMRQTLARVTYNSASQFPEWTPDGGHIIYAGRGDRGWDLFRVPADGSGDPQLLLKRPNDQWQGLITPDGRDLVVWEHGLSSKGDILIMPLDNPTVVRPLAQSDYFEDVPALSPDGKWLAYESDETGIDEVYIRGLDDTARKVLVSGGGGRARGPRWGPLGQEVFYWQRDSLFVVPVPAGTDSIGRRRALFVAPFSIARASYDVHPNGQEFVFVREMVSGKPSIQIVLNWFENLRFKVD